MHARTASVAATLRNGVGAVWRSKELRSILMLEVALMGTLPAFFLLSQPFLDAHGVSLALFGVLAIPVHVARTAAGLLSGRITRRFGLASTLGAAVVGAVAGLLILSAVDHVIAFAGLAIAMAAVSMALPAIGAYVNERTDSGVRATVLSVAPMGTSVTMAVMSVAAGTIGAHSLRLAFGAMAVAIAVVGGASFLSWLSTTQATRRAEIELVEV
jgi:MFS family permease